MFSGRVLIVSPRREVVAVIDPLVRAQGHIPLVVETAEDAMDTLRRMNRTWLFFRSMISR